LKIHKTIDKLLTADAMGERREIIKKGDAIRSTAWVRKKIFN
jgi:hypothetical protein